MDGRLEGRPIRSAPRSVTSSDPRPTTSDLGQPPVRDRQQTARLVLIAVIFTWGAGPVVTKLITVHPVLGVLIRFGLSVPVLFLIVGLRRRRVSMTTFRRAALPGLAFGVNLIFVFATLQEATVAVLSVMMAVQPGALLVLAGPLLGERARPIQAVWTLVGVVGAATVILGAGSELRASVLGVALALTSVVTFSVYFVLTRIVRSTTDVDPVEWMASINVWSFVAGVPPALFLLDRTALAEVSGSDIWWLVVLAFVTGVLGHVMMSWVHGYIEAARSSLALLAMNVVAVGLAWPVHDEPVTAVQILGGLIVLGSAAAVLQLESAPGSS